MNDQQKPAPPTEHKSFEEARDDAAEKYHGTERGNWGPDFASGWDACRAHIMQELKEVEAHCKGNIDYCYGCEKVANTLAALKRMGVE